jgi:hypothetical protein
MDDKQLLSIVRVFEDACGDGDPGAHYLLFGDVPKKNLELVKKDCRKSSCGNAEVRRASDRPDLAEQLDR